MRAMGLFLLAGVLEIGGGYGVWLWLKQHRSPWFGAAGALALVSYGVVPVFQPGSNPFGRLYAAYGAVFILLSALWGWGVDGQRPDLRDWMGVGLCLAGATVMLWPRAALAPVGA